MPTPEDNTTDNFLAYFNTQDTNNLMNKVFCPDNAPLGIPSVGLTDEGPQFVGAAEVQGLFQQLFVSFPDITLTQLYERLYSKVGPTRIAFQARIRARQDQPWFQKGDPHFSPPISDIVPDKVHLTHLPACVILTFDANSLVTNWTIYFDRYRMAQQLTPGFPSSTSLANSLASLARSLASLGGGRGP